MPAEDAKGLELALYAAPFLVGGLGTTLYSGRRAGITMAELMRMTPKAPAIHGGGAHPTFSFRDPLYTSMWRAEAASYPRASRVGRELLEIEMAAEKVKMCLSGDGGDELFAGYERYNRAIKHLSYDRIPGKRFIGFLSEKLPFKLNLS